MRSRFDVLLLAALLSWPLGCSADPSDGAAPTPPAAAAAEDGDDESSPVREPASTEADSAAESTTPTPDPVGDRGVAVPADPAGEEPAAEDPAGDATASEAPTAAVETSSVDELPPPRDSYMGRPIAQTMHWRGAEWLIRETREDEENAALMLDRLGIEAGDAVCDFGCGNGYHTLRLAERVAPDGKVFAVDIQEPMLAMLRRRTAARDIDNVEPVLASFADPNLPPASCDLVLMVDVYHELGYPERVLAALRRALKPDGRLVLVEFRAEDPDVPIKPLHKMSKAQIRAEMEANGFRHLRSFDELPWQHMETFGIARD